MTRPLRVGRPTILYPGPHRDPVDLRPRVNWWRLLALAIFLTVDVAVVWAVTWLW